MSFFPGDVIIKEVISAGLDDLRANKYLVQDSMRQFVCNPLLAKKYGQKEIDNAYEWLQNNKIEVALRYRNDKDMYPLVSIEMGSAPLRTDYQRLNDDMPSNESETFRPCDINKPIPYIAGPFVPVSYNPQTGFVETPESVLTRKIRAGQLLVCVDTGNAFPIVSTNCGVYIAPGSVLDNGKLAIAPKNAFYKARRKMVQFQEDWKIGCHVNGDPSTLLWLHTFVSYVILRYRVALERNGFAEMTITNTPLMVNGDFGDVAAEKIYSRFISISGVTESSWLDEPQRALEAVEIVDSSDGTLKPGLKIIANKNSPEFLNTSEDSWKTVKEYSTE